MARNKENIAVTHVMSRHDTEKRTDPISPQQHKAEIAYLASVGMLKRMLTDKVITAEEYHKIDTILAKKYGSYSFNLYR